MLAGRHEEEARTMMRMAVGMIAILAPLQLIIGDQHGLNTLKYQPAKVAAMEGHWDGSHPAPLVLFAIPDEKTESNRFEIAIPNLSALILTHEWNGLIKGLKDFPRDQRPPVAGPFFAFRIMVGLGTVMIVVGLVGAFLWWRGTLFTARLYQFGVAHFWWSGFVAVLAGWFVTENGRQPYLVYGVMRTLEGISPVSAGALLTSLILFVVVYGIVFAMGIFYINRLIAKGPQGGAVQEPDDGTPSRPLSGAASAGREVMAES
jgi:cytochrome d ubiquinol oxidase subunit I